MQVSKVDWSHQEKYKEYNFETCGDDPLFTDQASCLAFVGDDKKKCQWYEPTNPPPTTPPCTPEQGVATGCCWGTAQQQYSPVDRTIEITEQESQSAQTFITSLKTALDAAIAKLPTKNGQNVPKSSHPGVSNKTCAATKEPLDVETSLINVPQVADTMLRELNCLVAKIADQGDSITLVTVKAIYEGIQKFMNSQQGGGRPNPNPHQEDNDVNSFMATVNMFKAIADKYIQTI